MFNLAPEPVVFGDLNPNHTGLLFPGSEPEKPDLDSLLQDVPEEIRAQVNLAVEESHAKNCTRVWALDTKILSKGR